MEKSSQRRAVAFPLRQADTGAPVGDVCRHVGVSEAALEEEFAPLVCPLQDGPGRRPNPRCSPVPPRELTLPRGKIAIPARVQQAWRSTTPSHRMHEVVSKIAPDTQTALP